MVRKLKNWAEITHQDILQQGHAFPDNIQQADLLVVSNPGSAALLTPAEADTVSLCTAAAA